MCCAISINAKVNIGGKELASGKSFTSSSGVGITAGKISLSGSTLTLDGVTMTSSSACIDITDDPTLSIVVKGTNNLTTVDYFAIRLTGNITITGGQSDVLNVKASSTAAWPAIRLWKSPTLTINGCTIKAQGPSGGIVGYQDSGNYEGSVTIKGADVECSSNGTESPIRRIKSLTLNGSEISSPSGAAYNSSRLAICTSATSSTEVKSTVKITSIKYPIYIKGIQVTGRNKNDILGDGKVYLADATNFYVVYFNGATIDAGAKNAVAVDNVCTKNVYCTFSGTNKFTSSTDVFDMRGKGQITFDNDEAAAAIVNINCTGTSNCDAVFIGSDVTHFKIDKNLIINATTKGAYAIRSYSKQFTINKSGITATGGSYTYHGAIFSNAEASLTGAFIETPTWGAYNANVKGYTSYSDRNSTSASLANTVNVFIGEDYGVKVCGIGVNSTNYSTLNTTLKNKGYVTAGTVDFNNNYSIVESSYNYGVEFNGAKVNYPGNIVSSKVNVVIEFAGDNTLTATYTGSGNYPAFICTQNLYFRKRNDLLGSKATITSTGNAFYSEKNLEFWGTDITAKSNHERCADIGGSVTVDDSHIKLQSSKYAIKNATSLTLDGSYVRDRSAYNKTNKYYTDKNGAALANAEFYRGYGLLIKGTEVTRENCTTYGYSHVNKTLTASSNFTTSDTSTDPIILSYIPLNILVKSGKTINYICQGDGNPIKAYDNLTITCEGTGALNLDATSGYAAINIWGDGTTVTLKNANLTTKGYNGINGLNTKLIIDGGNIDINSFANSIYNIASLELKNVGIATPAGATFNASKKTIVDNKGDIVTGHLVFKNVVYALEIGDSKVMTANKDNIPVAGGSAKFDPETNTLTLNNATITSTANRQAINSEIPLTVNLIGTTNLNINNNYAIECTKDLTIKSASGVSGRLNITTNSYCIAGRAKTVIKDCIVRATTNGSSSNGIYGYNNGSSQLTIDNADVEVKTSSGKAITGFTYFSTNKVYFENPVKGKYNTSTKCVENANGVAAKEVSFKTGTDPHTVAPTVSSKEIAVSGATSSTIKLSWTAANDNLTPADKMEYFLTVTNMSNTSDFKEIKVIGQTSYELSGLHEETEYKITMRAYDEDGYWVAYNDKTAKTIKYVDTVSPTLPADATISKSNLTHNSVELSWNAASDNITAPASLMYEISYAIKSTGTVVAQVYNTGDKTTTKLTGLLPETTYEVTMDVFDEAGNESYYEKLTFTTLEAPDETKPELPTDAEITASDITATSVKLSWTAATDDKTPANKIKYEIGYGIKDAMTGDVQYTTGTTSFEFTGLKPETTYEFNIAAVDEAGNFVEYATFSVTTLAEVDETAPALPADATITVKEAADNSLTLSWNAASDNKTGAEYLRYEININSDGSWKTVASLMGVTEYKIEGLEPGTSYKIMIFVSDDSGNEASYDTLTTSTTGTNAIEAILAADPDVKMYNTSGVLVGKNYRGVVIINGKKYIKK